MSIGEILRHLRRQHENTKLHSLGSRNIENVLYWNSNLSKLLSVQNVLQTQNKLYSSINTVQKEVHRKLVSHQQRL